MRVIVSMTTIPSRINQALALAHNELVNQTCHEVWVNIPRVYKRFPDWKGEEITSDNPKVFINRECEDLGPATKVFGPALVLDPDDIIVYVDDDTSYDSKMVTNLLKWHRLLKCVVGLSGFNFENYFKGHFPREHGSSVDVIEGYGGVLVKAEWIHKLYPTFLQLTEEAKFADDVVLSFLMKNVTGIDMKTVFLPECNIITCVKQYNYGFGHDALHNQVQGGHKENYAKVLDSIKRFFAKKYQGTQS